MANRIQIRRAASDPTGGDLLAGELGLNTTNGNLWTSLDGSTVTQLNSSGGIGGSFTTDQIAVSDSSGDIEGTANFVFSDSLRRLDIGLGASNQGGSIRLGRPTGFTQGFELLHTGSSAGTDLIAYNGSMDMQVRAASGFFNVQVDLSTKLSISDTQAQFFVPVIMPELNPDAFTVPPLGSDPGTPDEGGIWQNTTSNEFKIHINSTTEVLATQSWVTANAGGGIGGSITNDQIAVGASTADEIEGSANLTYSSAGVLQLDYPGTSSYLHLRHDVTNTLQPAIHVDFLSSNPREALKITNISSTMGGDKRLISIDGNQLQEGTFIYGNAGNGATNYAGKMLDFRIVGTSSIGAVLAIEHAGASGYLIQGDSGSGPAFYVSHDGYIEYYGGSGGATPSAGDILEWNATNDRFEIVTPSGGSGIGGSIANDQLAIGAATANNIEGTANLTATNAGGSNGFYLAIGQDDTSLGGIRLYGTAIDDGGYIDFYNAADQDTDISFYRLKPEGTKLTINNGSNSELMSFQRPTSNTVQMDIGVADTYAARLDVLGDGASNGGQVRIYNGATLDTFVDYWALEAASSLQIKRDSTNVLTLSTDGNATFAADVTVQGSFTSVGIDDNATAERLQVGNNNTAFGALSGAGTYGLENRDDTGIFYISGSDSEILGSNIRLYGDAHATKANDFEIRADATDVIAYDHSTSTLNFIVTNLQQNGSAIGGGGTPAGANTQIQFNDNGSFGASSLLTWDGTNFVVGGNGGAGDNFVLNDTVAGTDDAMLKFIRWQRAGVDKGYIGYGSAANSIFTVSNPIGDVSIVSGTTNVVNFGIEDLTASQVRIHGDATSTGGQLRMYNAAGEDTTVDYWEWEADGNLRLRRGATTAMLVTTTGAFQFDSAGQTIADFSTTNTSGVADIIITGGNIASTSGFQLAQESSTSTDAFVWNLSTTGDLRFGAGNGLAGFFDATTKKLTLQDDLEIGSTGTFTVGAFSIDGATTGVTEFEGVSDSLRWHTNGNMRFDFFGNPGMTFQYSGVDVMRLNSARIELDNTLFIEETSGATADLTGYGQYWADTNGNARYTSDNGEDQQLRGTDYFNARADGTGQALSGTSFTTVTAYENTESVNTNTSIFSWSGSTGILTVNRTGLVEFNCHVYGVVTGTGTVRTTLRIRLRRINNTAATITQASCYDLRDDTTHTDGSVGIFGYTHAVTSGDQYAIQADIQGSNCSVNTAAARGYFAAKFIHDN